MTPRSALYGHLGDVLREAKGNRTVREIADRVGVAPATVSAWLAGTRRIAVEDLFAYGDAVDVKAEDLLADTRRRMVAQ